FPLSHRSWLLWGKALGRASEDAGRGLGDRCSHSQGKERPGSTIGQSRATARKPRRCRTLSRPSSTGRRPKRVDQEGHLASCPTFQPGVSRDFTWLPSSGLKTHQGEERSERRINHRGTEVTEQKRKIPACFIVFSVFILLCVLCA